MHTSSYLFAVTGRWLVGYGIFLCAMGIAGYSYNPQKAATALLSGGTFGALSMFWGWLMMRGFPFSRWAGFVTTVLLLGVFSWRAALSWEAVAEGYPEKFVPAILISLMAAASLVMALLLARLPKPALPVASR